MTTLREIREKIVDRLGRGEATADLEDKLAQEHARAAATAELSHLQEIASQRQEWQRRADALKVRVALHEANLDAYLLIVQSCTDHLAQAVEKSKAIVEGEKMAYWSDDGLHDSGQFMSITSDIPAGYLPGFACNFLVEAGGMVPAEGAGSQAVFHMQQALALLAGLQKAPITGIQKAKDEGI